MAGPKWKGVGSWYAEARRRIVARDGPGCAICGAVDVPLDLDHVVAVADGGGEWDIANLQQLCRIDHKAKSARETRARVRARAVPVEVGPSRRW